MGATSFETYQGDTDVRSAFHDAARDARDEHGHGGYTGSIAEKDSYVVLHREPVTLAEAYRLAEGFMERNTQGVDDKYGPAGAIAVRGGTRRVHGEIMETPGGYASLDEAAAKTLEARSLLRQGEKVGYGVSGIASRDARGRVVSGQFNVEVEGGIGAEQTGWLFFGMAAE